MRLAQHWAMSSTCDYPELTELQKGVIRYLHGEKGMGTVRFSNGGGGEPYIQFRSRDSSAIEEVNGHLGWFSRSVEKCPQSSCLWQVGTRTHPWLRQYLEVSNDG